MTELFDIITKERMQITLDIIDTKNKITELYQKIYIVANDIASVKKLHQKIITSTNEPECKTESNTKWSIEREITLVTEQTQLNEQIIELMKKEIQLTKIDEYFYKINILFVNIDREINNTETEKQILFVTSNILLVKQETQLVKDKTQSVEDEILLVKKEMQNNY